MDLLERLRQHAASLSEVKLAVLFGSTARGQARKGSDVDLGLLLDPDTRSVRLHVEADLARAAQHEVDVVYLNEAPPLLRFEITRDGILIFEREEGLWTLSKVKAMVDWWDWAPIARRINRTMIQHLRERVSDG
ncbi:MAG TPA: nucleotidyltransferase domain-containing protein [Thermoanaerobaculia bacterium]|jgi:predicted nucleotidyltransferase